MDRGTASGDENGDDENGAWEGPTAKQRVWNNCCAFIATILLIVGELMSEENMLGVVLIGGVLAAINVLITVSSLEKAQDFDNIATEGVEQVEDAGLGEYSNRKQRRSDMTAIHIDELPSEEAGLTERERSALLHHVSRDRGAYDRSGDIGECELEEMQGRVPVRQKKRSRPRRPKTQDDDDIEKRNPSGHRDTEGVERRRRTYKARREKRDGIERRERHRERDKRGSRSRDKKHKKTKRVTIAPGSAEHVVIGEV